MLHSLTIFDPLSSDPFEEYCEGATALWSTDRGEQAVLEFVSLKFSMTWEHERTLTKLPYSQFLVTRYWRVLREYVKSEAEFMCEDCGNGGYLQVHHNTYEHRGCEWRFLEDLEVLCSDCHKARHGLEA